MKLILNRPLVFFDIESTGLNVAKDRIIDISLVTIHPNNKKVVKTFRCNPGIPIPQEATDVHGISNEDVKDSPPFYKIANELLTLIKDCDLAGYNIHNFDTPMLVEEFLRAGFDFPPPDTKFIDVGVIFKKKEERTLSAAYKFYCNKTLDDAHQAEADTLATHEVLEAQLERYDDLADDIDSLTAYSTYNEKPIIDYARRLTYDENDNIVFAFGKHKGKKVTENRDYARWMMQQDFTRDTKNKLTRIFKDYDSGKS